MAVYSDFHAYLPFALPFIPSSISELQSRIIFLSRFFFSSWGVSLFFFLKVLTSLLFWNEIICAECTIPFIHIFIGPWGIGGVKGTIKESCFPWHKEGAGWGSPGQQGGWCHQREPARREQEEMRETGSNHVRLWGFLTSQVVILSEIKHHWVVLSMNLLILGQTISVLSPVLREGWEVVWTLGLRLGICCYNLCRIWW